MRRMIYSPETIVKVPNIFGTGDDGNVTISGTVTMTRDMVYENLTIPTGAVLITGGYRIYVKNTLINRGTIKHDGTNASGITFGGGGVGYTLPKGGDGASGRTDTGNGANGTGFGAALQSGNNGGGYGGGYTFPPGPTGGNGGSATNVLSSLYSMNNIGIALAATITTTSGVLGIGPGGGGGSGANNSGVSTSSGGGGGGGGFILIAAKQIDYLGGTISAIGGNGGNKTGAGDAAGGGGGGGGMIVLLCMTVVRGTDIVTGGTAGTGTGESTVANAGNPGLVIVVPGV